MAATTWIVAADASRARVFEVAPRERRLLEIEDFLNPEGRLGVGELISDTHEETRVTAHVTELFSKKIGRFLDKARTEHRYERLFIVAPPRFLGLVRKELGKEVGKLVQEELDKDLSWLSSRDIERYLKEAT